MPVGRLSFGKSHNEQPPPYNDSPPSVIVSETVTTRTTTTTTTHFFGWKKRPFVDKELPPTPPDDDYDSVPPPFSPRRSLAASPSALAHASLGLGLPNPIRTSASSSTSDVNTIAFATTGPPDLRPEPRNPPRRAKSSLKLRATSAYEPAPAVDFSHSEGSKRTRGVSLGASAAFTNLSGTPEANAKLNAEPSAPARKVSLARRASFWSRRKSAALEHPTPPAQRESIPVPSLPSVLPLTPFTIDDLSVASNARHHSRGLSRSHSARAGPELAEPSPVARPRRSTRRPATADSTARSPTLRPPTPPPPLPQMDNPPPPPPPETPAPSRRRAQTNPPLLYRLSMNLFSSSSSSTSPSLTQPPPMLYDSPLPSPALSASNSPRPSLTRPPSIIPKPEMDHESPEVYVSRLRLAVSKAEMAGILAASADSFHSRALRAYISEFDFTDDPLDVALRKLLMHVGLPRETQQIDRVMEAFAVQYLECNRNLFISDDHPYILAFSLIMLHTDAFNKSNKRKMTKADYIKNTRLPGVPSEVLDCFYDNIVFSPFIFVEDPVDVNGQRGLLSESATPVRALSIGNPLSASTSSAGSLLGKPTKVDVYNLIAKNNLGHLRVNIDAFVPRTTPYSWQGTAGPWDEPELQMAFAKPTMIEVGTAASVQVMPASFGAAGATPLTPSFSGSYAESAGPLSEVTTIRITKVGLLMRKDDFLEGGKKSSNRKWRSYSTILTGSQLLFFRDSTWANALAPACSADDAPPLPQTVFRPDELLSVRDCVAVFDTSYTKHSNVLRLVMPDGRQLLLQASNDDELNQWIARINYASTFKTAGIRMRPLGMSGKDVQLTGVAAATSHLHDLQHAQTAHRSRKWDNGAPLELMGMLNGPESPVKRQSVNKRATVSFGAQMELEVPTAPEIDGADQFKATFDNVKAELAAGHWSSIDSPLMEEFSSSSRSISLPSRTTIIQKKVDELKAKKSAASTQLDSDMRFVLNIGTLTPFQKATHDRLATAVRTISKRIMQVRLEMARLECHSEVLKSDIEAESRSWSEAKKVALQAATETLQQQQNRSEERIPRTIISFPEKTQAACDSVQDLSLRKRSSSSYHRPDSTADSFHSALDYSEDNLSSSGYLRVDTSSQGSTTSIPSDPDADGDAGPPSGRTLNTSHEKFYTAVESPEEWDQTRAGKRVSLVRLPSTYGLQRFSSARTTNSTMPTEAEGDL